jgi:hypothetical protein
MIDRLKSAYCYVRIKQIIDLRDSRDLRPNGAKVRHQFALRISANASTLFAALLNVNDCRVESLYQQLAGMSHDREAGKF